jgi:triacylglycerol esterase/lipase EstA (alpha/beta hydrolase family)
MEPATYDIRNGKGKPMTGKSCRTRYPIVLLHGLGYRDDMPLLASWGRIPETLGRAGASVFLGGLDAFNSHEHNATILKERIFSILADNGAEKVNIIAHSKGGIEARHMISRLGMAATVASLTTVCTPHLGTCMADIALRLIPCEDSFIFGAVDLFAAILGDRVPDSAAAIRELSRPFMTEFNRHMPDAPEVYYQSFGTMMHSPLDDPFYMLSQPMIAKYEGPNDGMVTTTSCQWGHFRGTIAGKEEGHGISHLQIIDFQRRDISGVDIPAVYVSMVRELKNLGF